MRDGKPEPGDLIAGKYRIEGLLGAGGMGTVYAVSHRDTGKRLALKCLLPSYVDNPSLVERFLREAKAVGRIQHRHVIDVFDQGRDGGVLYIVLPLLEGKPLGELLRDETITLDEALVILVRAMEGVAAANALGVLHRDLKPSNIFVCEGVSGRLDDPRVLDFGISKLDGELDQPLTRSGVAVGTPHYMSIEQLTGQRDLDVRADVYSMGVILYEALSGTLPHVADNVAALALSMMHIPPTPLTVRRPDLPVGLCEVVMRAIARDRDERYASMRELIQALMPHISEGAALTVREPVGRPLRTPRDLGEQEIANEMAALAATTKAALAGPPRTPSVPPADAARPSLSPPRRGPARSLAVVSLLIGSAVAIAWLQPAKQDVRGARRDDSAGRKPEQPVVAPATAMPLADAHVSAGLAATSEAVVDAGVQPSVRSPSRASARIAALPRDTASVPPPFNDAAVQPARLDKGTASPIESENRTGKLTTDEF
jgi:eukaryotic-like serine/threonine-protein kinase